MKRWDRAAALTKEHIQQLNQYFADSPEAKTRLDSYMEDLNAAGAILSW